MNRRPLFLLFAGLILSAASAAATIVPAPLFTDNAILQRDKPVPVWGKGVPGETVTVAFKGQKKETTVDSESRWKVVLDPMQASAENDVLHISGSTSGSIQLNGVLVGEVWFCSGQSNMLHIVSKCLNFQSEQAAADYPQIRIFKVWFNASETPLDTLTSKPSKWSVCQPRSMGSFPAVSYFFARDIYLKLGVPVGMINSSWGGVAIESWMSDSNLKSSPSADKVEARWKQFLADLPAKYAAYETSLAKWKEAGEKPEDRPREVQGAVSRWTPSGLYNAMVHPFIPYAVRGILWYQGEANTDRFDEYSGLFKSMITAWRKDFDQGDLPFYFVQLANFEVKRDATDRTWAFLREAQLAGLELPQTGVAVTVDIGDPKDAHYANKQEASRRLALVALANVYNQKVNATGPVFEKAVVENGTMRVSLKSQADLVLKAEANGGFELAGEDKKFHPAVAKLDGKTVVVSSPSVVRPVAVRYAWRNNPATSLFDAEGLPAVPFRSDDWTPPAPVAMETTDSGGDAG